MRYFSYIKIYFISIIFLAFAGVFGGDIAHAQTIGAPAATGSLGYGPANIAGQTITAPSALPLQSVQFRVNSTPAAANIGLVVREYDTGTNTPGAVIYTSPVQNIPGTAPVTLTFPGGNTVLTSGQTYMLQLTTDQPSTMMSIGFMNSYAGGFAYVNVPQPGLDTTFSATFAAPPIPSLSEWAMIGFALFLAGAALVNMNRRRLA